jgi:hypothetical protein
MGRRITAKNAEMIMGIIISLANTVAVMANAITTNNL